MTNKEAIENMERQKEALIDELKMMYCMWGNTVKTQKHYYNYAEKKDKNE